MTNTPPPSDSSRGLTLRSFAVTIVSILILSCWISYEELYCNLGGPIADNAPPTSVVGVMLGLIVICGLLYRVRAWLRLAVAELVFIYCALMVAAPLVSSGLWQPLLGLTVSIPHEQDFKTYESLPSDLWPHGPNLCANGRFQNGLSGFTLSGGDLRWDRIEWKGQKWNSPTLVSSGSPGSSPTLSFSIDRNALVPGDRFLLSLLVKTDGFGGSSAYFVRMRADSGPAKTLLVNTTPTSPTFAIPSGFERVGVCPVMIPDNLRRKLTFSVSVKGGGSLSVQDIQFLNVRAVEAAYGGRDTIRSGFIPLSQWTKPVLAWSVLVFAVFLGFFGINVVMRRQWVDIERYSFPLNVIPRHLFATEAGGVAPLFRNKVMWLGFGLTLALALMKGVHYYYPQFPSPLPAFSRGSMGEYLSVYFSNPLLRTLFLNTRASLILSLLAVALFVEKDILLSIWVSFFLFQLWNLFGTMFGLYSIPGYPWRSQSVGTFIAYAFVGILLARRHIWAVLKQVAGRQVYKGNEEVVSYRTAVLMILGSIALFAGWGIWTHMGVKASLLFFGFILVCGFAAGKIRAESGPPLTGWMPAYSIGFTMALGGFAVFGSTGMLAAAMAGTFMTTGSFLLLAPIQVEMMELGRHFKVKLHDIGYGLIVGLIGGILVGGFVVLCSIYGFGADNLHMDGVNSSSYGFHREYELAADRAFVSHTLSKPDTAPLDFVHNPEAKGAAVGFAVVCILAFLRSTFVWFPIHPLGYVLGATTFGERIWFTCLLAWLIRLLVLRIGGTHSIRRGLVPFAIGMFLACVTSVVIFDVVGIYMRSAGVTDIYAWWP